MGKAREGVRVRRRGNKGDGRGCGVRLAARRAKLREPGRLTCASGKGAIAALGSVLLSNVEASRLPFTAPVNKNVIARSSATRQSTRAGVIVHGDRHGRTRSSWAGAPCQRRSTSPTVLRRTPQKRHCEPPTPTPWAPTGSNPALLGPYPRRSFRNLGNMALAMGIFLVTTACVPKRSSATRQSTRAGVIVHGDRHGRTHSSWAEFCVARIS